MAIKRSPGCQCCQQQGCDILSEGRQFIAGPVSKSLGTSANNSILQIVLDQFEDPGPLDWTGTTWASYDDPPIAWIDGETIDGKDGWTATDAKIVTVDSVLRAGTTFGTVAYMSRTVEANGEWTYDWQTKVDTAWVQVWVNGVQVASHSENGTGYNTETIQLEAGDTIQFRIYSVSADDEASIGNIVASAYAAAPNPGYNGDTIDLGGKTVIPGFIESHGHLMSMGYARLRLNLMDATGLGSGTIFPTLLRFEDRQWIKGEWESIEPSDTKRPKRRLYQLTPDGKKMANTLLTEDVITMLSKLVDFQKKTAKPKTI